MVITSQIAPWEGHWLTINMIVLLIHDFIIAPTTGLGVKLGLIFVYNKKVIKHQKITQKLADAISPEILNVFVRNFLIQFMSRIWHGIDIRNLKKLRRLKRTTLKLFLSQWMKMLILTNPQNKSFHQLSHQTTANIMTV
jgi:hypothetical protein